MRQGDSSADHRPDRRSGARAARADEADDPRAPRPRAKGRIRKAAGRHAEAGLRPRAHRWRAVRTGGSAEAGQDEKAHHRGGRRSPDSPPGHSAAADGLAGDGHAAGRRAGAGERRRRRGHAVLPELRLSRLRRVHRGAHAAHVLVQQSLRRVPDLHGSGHADEDRPQHRHSRPLQIAERGRDSGLRLGLGGQRRHGPRLSLRAGRSLRLFAEHAGQRAERRCAGQDSLRHPRREGQNSLSARERQRHLLRALRGHHRQSGAALSRDELRGHEGRLRRLHVLRTLPGVRRPKAQARGAGRDSRRKEHRRGVRNACARRARLLRAAEADREAADHRPADPQGGSVAAGLPQRRGAGLSDAGAQRLHAVRRRSPAHPAGDANRLQSGGRAVHSG